MAVRSEISRKHLLRLGIVGLFCSGAALWFLYDGMVGWPHWRERGLDFMEFREQNPDLDPLAVTNAWKVRAEEKGWSTDNPLYKDTNEPITERQIFDQFIWAGVAGMVGLFFVGRLLLNLGCWVEGDEKGLRSSEGKELEYSQITKLNKKKWRSKGIAWLHYDDNGKERRLLLDDYIYERNTMDDILRKVEDNIDHAKIVNGKPEPPPKPAETPVPSVEGK
jgi:hypothetical protein